MYSVYIYISLLTNKWSLSVQMLWSSTSPRKKKKHPSGQKQGQPYIWIFIFSFQVWEGFHGRGGPPTMEMNDPSLPL